MTAAARTALRLLAAAAAAAGLPASGTAQSVRSAGEEPAPALTILEVPYLTQDPSLCGGAAAAMVLRYWGHDSARAADFAPLVRREVGGIRADELGARLRELGWETLLFRADMEALRRHLALGRPVITLVEIAPGRHHYVVAAGIGGDILVVHDPVVAPFQVMDRLELERRWVATAGLSLLVLPRAPGHEAPSPLPAGVTVPARRGERAVEIAAPETEPCARLLDEGIRTARQGRGAEAASMLEMGTRACPSAPFYRELAGLQLREGRTKEAVGLAEAAVRAEPRDPHALRTLAAAYYVEGRAGRALRVWNRLGGPALDRVHVQGGEGIHRQRVVERLGLRPGQTVTPGALRLAERRLGDLPAASGAKVAYEPLPDGRADAVAAVRTRAGFDPGRVSLARMGLEALFEAEAGAALVSPSGSGELWAARWRWREHRPALFVGLAVPSALGPPATWRLDVSWERETVSARVLGSPHGAAGEAGALESREEERTWVALSAAGWATWWLRWEVLTELDRWSEGGSQPGVGVALELRSADDRWSSRLGLHGWAATGRAHAFAAWQAAGAWRSGPDGKGTVWKARLGVAAVTRDAPSFLWPGAGTGSARTALLRAHPLLEDGIVVGRAFDRTLAGGGLEVVRWLGPRLLPVGLAGFLDAAHVRGQRSPETLADLGVGLRIGLPGADASLRADLARGVTDDAWAFSVGWSLAGLPIREAPGWDGRR